MIIIYHTLYNVLVSVCETARCCTMMVRAPSWFIHTDCGYSTLDIAPRATKSCRNRVGTCCEWKLLIGEHPISPALSCWLCVLLVINSINCDYERIIINIAIVCYSWHFHVHIINNNRFVADGLVPLVSACGPSPEVDSAYGNSYTLTFFQTFFPTFKSRLFWKSLYLSHKLSGFTLCYGYITAMRFKPNLCAKNGSSVGIVLNIHAHLEQFAPNVNVTN